VNSVVTGERLTWLCLCCDYQIDVPPPDANCDEIERLIEEFHAIRDRDRRAAIRDRLAQISA